MLKVVKTAITVVPKKRAIPAIRTPRERRSKLALVPINDSLLCSCCVLASTFLLEISESIFTIKALKMGSV